MPPTAPIEWRVGTARIVLAVTVHAVSMIASIAIALDWYGAWLLVGAVGVSTVDEAVRWSRARGCVRRLELFAGGVAVDSQRHRARRAWLGPGWSAIWLTSVSGRRRLLHVMRGEVSQMDHAALRRHVKSLEST